jgi:hypothetical protein
MLNRIARVSQGNWTIAVFGMGWKVKRSEKSQWRKVLDTRNPGIRGKTKIPKRLVSTQVLCDLSYTFHEEVRKILALRSMG